MGNPFLGWACGELRRPGVVRKGVWFVSGVALIYVRRSMVRYDEDRAGPERQLANWKGSLTERFIEEHEGFFRWLLIFAIGGLVARFVLEGLGLWPWA